jgi:3-dehydroquinate synthetase
MKTKLTYLKKLELFKELDAYREGHFFAIADQKVKNHLPQWIQFSPDVFWLKEPEKQKNLEVYGEALEFFLKQGIQRGSKLYGFGGGATTDLTGFVASTILRGIRWVSIPTTLLGMVDGSIGGKVAINMSQGKNLVGAFHSPEEVFICGDFLSTLNPTDIMSGKGEVLKYGFLSRNIADLILSKAPLETIIVECARYKNVAVEEDFREQGNRILLNLGHTMGHAFESTLKIPHGQAIIMGLKYLFQVMKLNEALGYWHKMTEALDLKNEDFILNNFPEFNTKDFFSYMDQDKKKLNSSIRLVLVKDIGSCYLEEVPLKDFKTKILSHDEFINK